MRLRSSFLSVFGVLVLVLFCLQPAFATLSTPTYDFIDNGDGTVTHKKTGLMWMRCTMGQTWTGLTCSGEPTSYKWDDAIALRSNFAGKSDWRLPNADEVLSIVGKDSHPDDHKYINNTIFPNAPNYAWSSSSGSDNYSSGMMAGNFGYGVENYFLPKELIQVRLVRGKEWVSTETLAAAHAAAVEAKCMITPKCRAKKEREQRQRELAAQREQERACDRLYTGKPVKFTKGEECSGGGFTFTALTCESYWYNAEIVGVSKSNGLATARAQGKLIEKNCSEFK